MISAHQILWHASIIAQSGLAIFLLGSGLWRTFRIFTAYLAIGVCVSLVRLQFEYLTTAYGWVWLFTEPLLIAFQILASLEAFRLTTREYPNIGRLGVFILTGGLLFALLSSIVLLAPEQDSSGWSQLHRALLVSRRFVSSLIAAFLTFASLIFFLAPPRISANVRAHRRLLTLYFCFQAVGQFMVNITGPHAVVVANMVILSAITLSYGVWALVLRPAREVVDNVVYTNEQIDAIEAQAAELLSFVRAQTRRPGRE